MPKQNNYKIAIFDCDGVILNSNQLKSDAFRKSLEGEPESLVEKFIAYHQTNGGVSRYVKFKYFYEQIKPTEVPDLKVSEALKKYAEIVKNGLLKCNVIPGVIDYLEHLNSKNTSCYINSGSDEEELIDVLDQRGISRFFNKICGSPATKKDNMQKILTDNVNSDSAIYFGDAFSDYSVSKDADIEFIYVSGVSEWHKGVEFCEKENIEVIENFLELPKIYK